MPSFSHSTNATSSAHRVSTPVSKRDGPVRWALNALRLNKDGGSAIALQEREGSIFVCVRKGEATQWVAFHKVMTQPQLQGWIRDGGFARS